jgi:hypothetical protein
MSYELNKVISNTALMHGSKGGRTKSRELSSYPTLQSRRTDFGRPASAVKTAIPMAASIYYPEKERARNFAPILDLYRHMAVSTKARIP